MLTLPELKAIIHKEIEKRDFLYEHTPANRELFNLKCEGTYEAVMTGNSDEKYLIPQVGTLHFLYRGQSVEYIPCYPSLYRGTVNEVDVFIERMRLTVFKSLLNSHPVVEHFFKRNGFMVDAEGLAQHYGLKTSVLDLTSSLDIALFFAMCPYDCGTDSYTFHDDGLIHDAVLYVFLPYFDNEPSPSLGISFLNGSIRPIGLQAFERPGKQQGYGLHLKRGESIKAYMYRFSFTCEDSKRYYQEFGEKEKLWAQDKLVEKVKEIVVQNVFSYDTFNRTYEEYAPKGNAVIDAQATIGNHCIVESGCVIQTKVKAGNYITFGAGAVIGNNVTIEDNVFIGTGVRIIAGVTIGENARIGAGSVVMQDVAAGKTVFGNPAVEIKR